MGEDGESVFRRFLAGKLQQRPVSQSLAYQRQRFKGQWIVDLQST